VSDEPVAGLSPEADAAPPSAEDPGGPAVATAAVDASFLDFAEPPAGARIRPPRIRDIDFSRPTKFSQEHQRRIVRLHETFCRALGTQLSPDFRMPLEFELINATQMSWASATAELPSASLFGLMDVLPGTERALIACELPLLHFCLDRMLGGDGSARQARAELTEIELALSQRLMERLTTQLSLVWGESVDTTFELAHVDTQLANAQLVPASEAVLALTVEVRPEIGSSTFTVLFPHVAVEPALEKLSVGHFGERHHVDHDGGPVRAALLPIEVELRVDVGSLELTVDEALRLQPGDVLEFGAIESGVRLCGGDTPTHICRPGRVGEFRAVEILAETGSRP